MAQNNLSKNLSLLRRVSGLSQEKAAEAVGVTRQALAKWLMEGFLKDFKGRK